MTDELLFYDNEINEKNEKNYEIASKKNSAINPEIKISPAKDFEEIGVQCEFINEISNETSKKETSPEGRLSKLDGKKSINRRSGEAIDLRQSLQTKIQLNYNARHSMNQKQSIEGEEYNIYGYSASDKVDEEKIKMLGQLLTTMNMDNPESGS